MKQQAIIAVALGSLLVLGALSTPVQAADAAGKEKCYGVAKAGQNDCASPGSAHACAGVDRAPSTSRLPRAAAMMACCFICVLLD